MSNAFDGFRPEALDFLVELALNNDRSWFGPRKAEYEALLKTPLERLCTALDGEFRARGLPLSADPARSPFRIYRDVRFAKDKSPYKTNVGASFPWTGEGGGVGGYFHLEPGHVFVGGGMWHPAPPRLAAWRAAVSEDPERVHGAIDDLGRRLAQRVMNERAFSAHAAHALRTPLAGMDAQLAVALRECPPALQPRLQQVRAASMRLQRVVRALLDLFRTGGEVQRSAIDLPGLLSHLPIEGVEVELQATRPLSADADLLAAALANLLDNARRHGARHVRIDTPQADTLRLADDGPGMPAERLAALRGALASQSYDGPTGLGLMLADRVARAHGGALTLPDASGGFVIELKLA